MFSSRERFVKTMGYGVCDRAPYFEEGIRPEVLKAWRKQGMPRGEDLSQRFPSDERLEIEVDLDPRPTDNRWPKTRSDLAWFRQRLDSGDVRRLPKDWPNVVCTAKTSSAVHMLKVHRGLFLSMGVQQWDRFYDLMLLLGSNPGLVQDAMLIQGEFAARLVQQILSEIRVEAAIFSEPIGGNHGPLISPAMYEKVVLTSYKPLFEVLACFKVETIIFRTYANARLLIPSILNFGFNCLWACEVDSKAMDYRALRREYGRELRLIGGIDLDSLRRGKEAIYREVTRKVPPLLADGGYAPLADGRVRTDVPYDHYIYYRKLLRDLYRTA